jgi:hypothetical protein
MPCGRMAKKQTALTWRCIEADWHPVVAPCGSGSRSALVAEGPRGADPHQRLLLGGHLTVSQSCRACRCRHQLRRDQETTAHSMIQIPCIYHHTRFDVVKTRLQAGSASGTTMQVMRAVVRAEGWRALFSGWTAAVARAFPANAGLFAGVELASRLMGSSG